MISRLITILQQADLLLTDDKLASLSEAESILNDEDIADAIWLALKMDALKEEPEEEDVVEAQRDRETSTITIDNEIIEPPPKVIPVVLPDKQADSTAATTDTPERTSAVLPDEPIKQADSTAPTIDTPEQGLPIQVRAAPALQDAHSLARSLRPLMRKARSLTQAVLDEVETVNRIAEHDVWVPVLKRAPERWLDLELVIESSQFSFIWQSTLDEFQQILERQGAFRNVRTWRVKGVDDGELQLIPKKQTLTEQTPFRSPKELIDASGRRLVLYVSDCRTQVWKQGKIHDWLRLWSQHGPTAIVQLLPERLWEESELDVGFGIQVSALIPGVPNSKLVVERSAYANVEPDQALILPVVTLTARSLKQLALVVAAIGNQRAPARLFDLSWVTDPDRDRAPFVIHLQTAEQRVELFLATASPIAQRLARLMAAVPVNLPVVHLIQEQLLKDSNPVHVAEVYSSSLLVPVEQPTSTDTSVRYEFAAGVRQLLNESTPEDETIDVLEKLSQEIASTLGLPPIKSFTALLSPKSEWTQAARAREAILHFAQIATQVLHNLGGEYASLAQTIERDAVSSAKLSAEDKDMNKENSITKVLIVHITDDRIVAENLRDLLLPLGGTRLECLLWEEDRQNRHRHRLEDLKRRIEDTDLLLLLVASEIVDDKDWLWLQRATVMSWSMSNGHDRRILLHNKALTPPRSIQEFIDYTFKSELSKIKDFLNYFLGSTEFTKHQRELNTPLTQQNTELDKFSETISSLFPETNPAPILETFQKVITLIVENPARLTIENLSQEIRIQSQTPGSLELFGLAEARPWTNDNWSWEDLPSDNSQGWLIELADFIWEAHRGRRREPPVVQSTFQSSDGSLYKPILYAKENWRDGSERFTVIFVRHFSAEWVYNAPNVSLSTLLTASILGARLQWEVCDRYLPELDRWQRNGTEAIRKGLQQVKVSFENIEKDAEFRSRSEARGVKNEVRLRNSFDSKDEQNIIAKNMSEQEQYKQTLLQADTQDNVDEVRDALTQLRFLNSIVMDMVATRYSQLLTQLRNEISP